MFHETQHKNQGGFFGIYTYFCWQFHHLEMVNLRTMGWRYPSLDWFKAKILTGKDGFGVSWKKIPISQSTEIHIPSKYGKMPWKCHERWLMNIFHWERSTWKSHHGPTLGAPTRGGTVEPPQEQLVRDTFFPAQGCPFEGDAFYNDEDVLRCWNQSIDIHWYPGFHSFP